MSKARLFFWIMWANLAVWAVEVFSGFLVWLILPYGSKSTFIFTRMAWVDIHKWAAIPITLMIIIHIAMHWGWIVRQTKSLLKIPARQRAFDQDDEPDLSAAE